MRGPIVQPGPRRASLDQLTPPPRKYSSSWSATLQAPTDDLHRDTVEAFVVDVVGNIDLAGVPMRMRLEPRVGDPHRWVDATAVSVKDNHGTYSAFLAPRDSGRYDVVVKPVVPGQRPTIYAGRVAVH